MVNANAVPALHDGQEGDEGGNDPAAANHQSHSHGRHLVAVDQGLAADGVVPAQTTRVKATVMEKNMWRIKQERKGMLNFNLKLKGL